jgi:hypothetical protein
VALQRGRRVRRLSNLVRLDLAPMLGRKRTYDCLGKGQDLSRLPANFLQRPGFEIAYQPAQRQFV